MLKKCIHAQSHRGCSAGPDPFDPSFCSKRMSGTSTSITNPVLLKQGNSFTVSPGQSVRIGPPPCDDEPVTFEQLPLFQYFKQVSLTSETMDSLLLGCGDLIAARSACLGLWVTQKSNAEFAEVHSLRRDPDKTVWQSVESVGMNMIKLANSSRQIQYAQLPENFKPHDRHVPRGDGSRCRFDHRRAVFRIEAFDRRLQVFTGNRGPGNFELDKRQEA